MRIFIANIFPAYFYKLLMLLVLSSFAFFACKNHNLPSGLTLSGALNEQALIQYTDSIAVALNNDPVRALALFDSVIEISVKLPFNRALINALYQCARYKNRSGDYSGASNDLQRAYKNTDTDSTEMVTLILIEMADNQQLMIQYADADSLLQVAEALADKNKSANHLAAIHNIAANIESGRGNLVKATELYLNAAAYFNEIHDSANLAVIYENVGLIYRNAGNYEKAFEFIRHAYNINHSLSSDIGKIAINQNNLGVLFIETHQPDSSIELYQKSLNLYRKLCSKSGMAMSYMNIANVMTGKNDFELASKYYDSSLFVISEMRSEYGFVLEKINRAGFFIKKGEAKKAIPMLEASLGDCRRLKLISEETEVMKLLYEAWLQEGNYKNALFYFSDHHQTIDSLKSTEIHEKLAKAQNDFEIKNREVKVLKLEKSLSVAAAKTRNQRNLFLTSGIILMLIAIILFYRKRSAENYSALIKAKLDKAITNLEMKNMELIKSSKKLIKLKEYTETLEKEKRGIHRITEPSDSDQPTFLKQQNGKLHENGRTKEFETRFDQVHEAYFSKLLHLHPNLSPAELRICGFLRSNMTSKEIAVLTNRSVRTIENTRNNIRIKMQLPADTRMISYLLGID